MVRGWDLAVSNVNLTWQKGSWCRSETSVSRAIVRRSAKGSLGPYRDGPFLWKSYGNSGMLLTALRRASRLRLLLFPHPPLFVSIMVSRETGALCLEVLSLINKDISKWHEGISGTILLTVKRKQTRESSCMFLGLPEKGGWEGNSHAPRSRHMPDKQWHGRKGRAFRERRKSPRFLRAYPAFGQCPKEKDRKNKPMCFTGFFFFKSGICGMYMVKKTLFSSLLSF